MATRMASDHVVYHIQAYGAHTVPDLFIIAGALVARTRILAFYIRFGHIVILSTKVRRHEWTYVLLAVGLTSA
jgi:hypothetical protein